MSGAELHNVNVPHPTRVFDLWVWNETGLAEEARICICIVAK